MRAKCLVTGEQILGERELKCSVTESKKVGGNLPLAKPNEFDT